MTRYPHWIVGSVLVLTGTLGSNLAVWAEEPLSAQVAAKTELDPGFLLLPAFDLDRIPQADPSGVKSKDAPVADAGPKVGSPVLLRVQGVNLPGIADPSKSLKLEVPPGTEDLTDQGWEVAAVPDNVPAGEFWIKVVPLKAGSLTLPSLALKDASDKAVARTNPFTLTVPSSIRKDDPKPEQPEDMAPPVSLRFPWWLIAVGVLGVLMLLGGAIYGYLRWRKRVRPVALAKPAEPPRPEDEMAFAALAELERQGPLKRGEFKAHYFRLSEILKIYIGRRYRFDAAESTTRELIRSLEERGELGDQRLDRLETLFEKLDLVKFTDHVPLPDEGLRLLELTREFVQLTRRPPPAIVPEEGAR
jgi:hypothetical protein